MMSDQSQPMSSQGRTQGNPKQQLKANLASQKIKEKNDVFYVKKRGLFRKAEQVVRYCNSDVFIIVHNKDSDKIFSFTSDKKFNLESITSLILRDVIHGACLHKNRKFDDVNFEKVRRNIEEIAKIESLFDEQNETLPADLIQRKNEESMLKNGGGNVGQEDSESMSIQQTPNAYTQKRANERSMGNRGLGKNDQESAYDPPYKNEASHPMSTGSKLPQDSSRSSATFAVGNQAQNTHPSNPATAARVGADIQQTLSHLAVSQQMQYSPYFPSGAPAGTAYSPQEQMRPQQITAYNAHFYQGPPPYMQQQQQNEKLQQAEHQQQVRPQHGMQPGTGSKQNSYMSGASGSSMIQSMVQPKGQPHAQQQQSFGLSVVGSPGAAVAEHQRKHVSPSDQAVSQVTIQPGNGRESLVRSKESGDNRSDLASSDMDRHHSQRFARITNERQMKDTVNNDDILWCSDLDRDRIEAYQSQIPQGQLTAAKASIIQPPHPTIQGAGMPGVGNDSMKITRMSAFNGKKISVTSGDQSGGPPQSARRRGMASIVLNNPRTRPVNNTNVEADQPMEGHVTPPMSPTSHMGADLVHKIIASPRAEINASARVTSMRDYTKYKKTKKSQITKVSVELGRTNLPEEQDARVRSRALVGPGHEQYWQDQSDNQRRDLTPEQQFAQSQMHGQFPYPRRYIGGEESRKQSTEHGMHDNEYDGGNRTGRAGGSSGASNGQRNNGIDNAMYVQSVKTQHIYNINVTSGMPVHEQQAAAMRQQQLAHGRGTFDEREQQEDFAARLPDASQQHYRQPIAHPTTQGYQGPRPAREGSSSGSRGMHGGQPHTSAMADDNSTMFAADQNQAMLHNSQTSMQQHGQHQMQDEFAPVMPHHNQKYPHEQAFAHNISMSNQGELNSRGRTERRVGNAQAFGGAGISPNCAGSGGSGSLVRSCGTLGPILQRSSSGNRDPNTSRN